MTRFHFVTRRFRFLLNTLLVAGLCTAVSSRAQELDPKSFLTVIPGDLPILLSAPHGGTGVVPGATVRGDNKATHFVVVTDVRTDILAKSIAADLQKKTGHSPYVVIAKFSRKYADPNRDLADATESAAGRAVYLAYHDAIKAAVADIQKRWGVGLVLDLHGQGKEKGTIFRGTGDQKTVRHMVTAYGPDALNGAHSVMGGMAALGYPVYPTKASDSESNHFDGGYITQTYGSAKGGTIDSMQMEYGTDLRTVAAIPKTADDTATAIAAYLKAYLLKDPAK